MSARTKVDEIYEMVHQQKVTEFEDLAKNFCELTSELLGKQHDHCKQSLLIALKQAHIRASTEVIAEEQAMLQKDKTIISPALRKRVMRNS